MITCRQSRSVTVDSWLYALGLNCRIEL